MNDAHGHDRARRRRSLESELFDTAMRRYGGADHVPGRDGHQGPREAWRACHRCHEITGALAMEALGHGQRRAERAGTVGGDGLEEALEWFAEAGAGYIKRALSSVGQVLRPQAGRLANPTAAASNQQYQAAFRVSRSAGALTCTQAEATAVLAAVLEQVHRGWEAPEGQLVDWEKAVAHVEKLVGTQGTGTDPEHIRQLWETEVEPALRSHPRADEMLTGHLDRHPWEHSSGDTTTLTSSTEQSGGPDAEDPVWRIACRLLTVWSDDAGVRRERARAHVDAVLLDLLGSTEDLPDDQLDRFVDQALLAADEARVRPSWFASVTLAIGPRMEAKLLVKKASAELQRHLCVLLDLAPDELTWTMRTADWRDWLDRVIVDACDLHTDIHAVRDQFRKAGVTAVTREEMAAAVVAVLKKRHRWTKAEVAHHTAQPWFTQVVTAALSLPLTPTS